MKINKVVVTQDEAKAAIRSAMANNGVEVVEVEVLEARGTSEFNRMWEALVIVRRAFPRYRGEDKIAAIRELIRISGIGGRAPMGLAEAKQVIEMLA